MAESVRIYLTDSKKTRFTFPMLPEEISVQCGAQFQNYDIMTVGEVKIPYGSSLTRISWDGMLPGGDRNGEFILTSKKPKSIQGWFSELRENKEKCSLLISGTPINHKVYIEDYDMTYSGGYGDYHYSISFIQALDLKIETEGKVVVKASSTRVGAEKSKTYTVKIGDSLWSIAQSQMGDGNRYPELYAANEEKIKANIAMKGGGFPKYMIWAGSTFQIP